MKALSRVSRDVLAAVCRGGALIVFVALTFAVALASGAARASAPAGAASALPLSMAGEAAALPTKLIVGVVAGGWPPFDVLDGATLTGFSADYLRLAVGAGVALEPRIYRDMPALLAAACAGQVDVIMSLARSPLRERCLAFTAPYLSGATVYVTRPGNEGDVTAVRQLVHAHLAVERGYALEPVLRERFPLADIRTYASTEEALRAVAAGSADVYAGFEPAVRYQLSSEAFRGLRVAYTERMLMRDLRFAVPVSKSALRDRLNLALAGVRSAAASGLRARWLGGAAGPAPLSATPTGVVSHTRGWTVNALRLLPFVIAFGVALLVTLHAYVLLQREMRRRRRAEQILARQVELQDTMMEMIPYPLVARDLDNRYIAVNRAYEETTGRQRAGVIGRATSSIAAWGADNSRLVDELCRRTLSEGDSQRIELLFERPGGEPRHGIFWTRLCRDAHDVPFCVLGTMIDITEIRRAELRARESERLLADVTSSLPAIVFQLRRAPDGAYTFPYLGGDTRRLLGDEALRLARARALDLTRVHRHDRAYLFALLEGSAHDLVPVNAEFRYHGAAGLLWVRAEFMPRRADDGAVLWTGYAVDANLEHTRADELARARDLAEAGSRAKDDFLAMMSHEIRTPMNGVLGLVEVLGRTPLNADQTQIVGMVHESAGALLQILDDLLDYSKIEAGRLVIVNEPFELRELVDNAVGLLAQRAHEKGLKVRVDIGSEVAARLRSDSVRLRQILFNLLSNAIKFTPSGEVSVSVATMQRVDAATSLPARQRLALTVADTGIGIAPEAQPQLFEPFVQAESSTTRRFGGTGLGLTICRRLAALMGGTLELTSVPGRGTAVTLQIELPIETRSAHANGLVGKRAYVLCDDSRLAAALTHFGTSLGMHMTRVTRAELDARPAASLADRADLVLASDSYVSGLPEHGVPVIHLTEKPKPTGYRIAENGVRVSVNPLSWRGLSAACATALAAPPAAPACSASGSGVALVTPERESERAAGRLILVAEDHPVNQELIRHQLALLGFACDVVNDGAEALAALEAHRYGCLITDCHMPNVSGYDLARRVRAIEQERGDGGRLPILAITANTAPENLQLCHAAGMDDCLVKPTRVATLRVHLARWFGADDAHGLPDESAAVALCANPAVAVPAAAGNGEPLDLARMTQVWGSEATVKALLESFVSAVRDDLNALPPLLETAEIARMRAWHHRLAGAVGVLHYPAMLALLETYRRHMNTHTPVQLRDEGLALVHTCHAMLNDIEKQAALLA
jgi:two-component system, NarL family, sensor histidine kinase EvgS